MSASLRLAHQVTGCPDRSVVSARWVELTASFLLTQCRNFESKPQVMRPSLADPREARFPLLPAPGRTGFMGQCSTTCEMMFLMRTTGSLTTRGNPNQRSGRMILEAHLAGQS